MLSSSEKFLAHLRASHIQLARVELFIPNEAGVYESSGYLGIVGGSLSMVASRNIQRQANVDVTTLSSLILGTPPGKDTRDYLENLTAQSAEIEIHWGIRFPDLTEEWVTLARLRVEESTIDAISKTAKITAAYDLGAKVTDFPLPVPYNPTGLTYTQAIQELVNQAYPSALPPTWEIGPTVDTASLTPEGLAFTGDRWAAINKLAQAINVRVGPNHLGVWVIQAADRYGQPVWKINVGDDGVLVAETTNFSRREQYNAASVRWEGPDNAGGIAYVTDDDPRSLTYYEGPFGKKPRPEEPIATITSQEQALAAAQTLLEKGRGRTRGISLSALHNPLLEPGDVITVWLNNDRPERHAIDSITIPLLGGVMSLETRVLSTVSTQSVGITYNEAEVIYEAAEYTYEGHPAGGAA